MSSLFAQTIRIAQPSPAGAGVSNALVLDALGGGTALSVTSSALAATLETTSIATGNCVQTQSNGAFSVTAGGAALQLLSEEVTIRSAAGMPVTISATDGGAIVLSQDDVVVSEAAGNGRVVVSEAAVSLENGMLSSPGSVSVDGSGAVSLTAAPGQNISLNVSGGGQVTGLGLISVTLDVPSGGAAVAVPDTAAPMAGTLAASCKGAPISAEGAVVWAAPALYDLTRFFTLTNGQVQLYRTVTSTSEVVETGVFTPFVVDTPSTIVSVAQKLVGSASRIFALNTIIAGVMYLYDIVVTAAGTSVTNRSISKVGGLLQCRGLAVIGNSLFIGCRGVGEVVFSVALVIIGTDTTTWEDVSQYTVFSGVSNLLDMKPLVASPFLVLSYADPAGEYAVSVRSTAGAALSTLSGSSTSFLLDVQLNRIAAASGNECTVGVCDNQGIVTWRNPFSLGAGVALSIALSASDADRVVAAVGSSLVVARNLVAPTPPVLATTAVTGGALTAGYPLDETADTVGAALTSTAGVGYVVNYAYESSDDTLTRGDTVVFSEYASTAQAVFNLAVNQRATVISTVSGWPGEFGEELRLAYDAGLALLQLSLAPPLAGAAVSTPCRLRGFLA